MRVKESNRMFVTVRDWIWCSEQEERFHCTSKLTSRQWIEWHFFKVMFAFVVMLSSKMALMLCRKIILLCFFIFGVMEERCLRNLSVFIFNCPLMSQLFCHSSFCAPIILFNGHVDININAFHFGGTCWAVLQVCHYYCFILANAA